MLSATTFSRRLTRLARPPLASLPAVQRSTFYHKAPAMSLLESRRRVVPSLWDRCVSTPAPLLSCGDNLPLTSNRLGRGHSVFRKEWDDVEKMLAPGFTFEVRPGRRRQVGPCPRGKPTPGETTTASGQARRLPPLVLGPSSYGGL